MKNLNPYLESNAVDVIFVYMIKGTRLTENQYKEIIKKLPEQMSTRAMTLKDQWLSEGIEILRENERNI